MTVSPVFANLRAVCDHAERIAERDQLADVPDHALPALGEPGAVVLIARCSQRLAAMVTRAARTSDASYEDLEQAAMLGMLAALPKFDPDRGTEPFTYARPYIHAELNEIAAATQTVPASRTAYDRFWHALAACDGDPRTAREWSHLSRLTGHELMELADNGNDLAARILDRRIARWESRGDDVAEHLADNGRGLTRDEFDTVHAAVMYISLDAPTTQENHATTRGALVACDAAQNAYAHVDNRMTAESILATLDERDRYILAAHSGFGGVQLTDAEIGAELGISRPRVANIRKKLCARLAQQFTEQAEGAAA